MNFRSVLCRGCLCLFVAACGDPIDQTGDEVAGRDAAAGVSTLLANIAATLQTSFLTAQNAPELKPTLVETVFNQIFGFAYATVTSCTATAYSDTCASGLKEAIYSGCTVSGSSRTFTGTIRLNFSSSTCAFTAAGQTITRQIENVRYVTAVDTYTTRTGSRTDYRGTTIGGGTQLAKTAGGYEVNVLGFNKFYTAQSGAVPHDVSIRSSTNLALTDPTSSSITFTSGTLEVVDSVNEFVASYVPANVVIDYSTCCYPSSGSMTVNYTSGSLTGSALVNFYSTSCGAAIVTSGSDSGPVPLWGCQ